ncbi:MAG TPA: collagen-like protein [Solirubrobacteraceae bacterium]|nr:collagen-like protein [Solirubrobacteraceae bacterium]
MFQHITRRRPAPATVIASLALFVSLGGVGYAAATIGSAQIKNNSVQGKDIRNGTIKTPDIAASTRNALKGKTGPAGLNGAPGAPGQKGVDGAKGDTGAAGATNVTVVRTSFAIPSGSTSAATAECPAGSRATGGGVAAIPSNEGDAVIQSGPTGSDGLFVNTTTGTVPTKWFGRYRSASLDPTTGYVWAICAAP